MWVQMSADTQAYCLMWNTTLPNGKAGIVDVARFRQLLAEHPQTTFDEAELLTSWGLLIVSLHSPAGSVSQSVNLDLLCLTNEPVISNEGKIVDRYTKLVEELLATATKKLQRQRSSPLLLLP